MWDHLLKCLDKIFQQPHIQESKYSVLNQKNVVNENILYTVYFKKLLYIVNISCGFL